MRSCATCGTVFRPIRDDGDCYPCHIRGIGFRFVGAYRNRESFHGETIGEVRREMERSPDAVHVGSGSL